MNRNFWLAEITKLLGYGLVAYACGRLVALKNIKVNYTRKVNFFNFFLLPFVVARLFPYHADATAIVTRGVFIGAFFLLLTRPVRSRLPVFATMFASFDRPEDRPHTLYWFVTQIIGGYAVLLPMSAIFDRRDISNLLFIPILIHGFGDGLAEPVGIRYGRHNYSVRAFLDGSRRYTRSYEGSACVWLAGIVSVFAFYTSFTTAQLVAALIIVPVLTTLAEAWSPHTWDTPYMFLAGTVSLLAIKSWV